MTKSKESKRARAAAYAREMKQARWLSNGESRIQQLDDAERLIDGQDRLLALLRKKTP